ncbi:CRISPR-associated protein TM1802 [Moorella glycerini]|uniref:CRISPR-associated protein n=1 Tax=Neomoorella stamsii TaxID=1266720 RepID=A0A9X7J140_9FIRM|nr:MULTISPECIES: TIGR02556 family CRISPR-associated protein [Moorella]PRR69534.1 CRISPR-associated protein [Moorella stamsii]CEP68812.1 CRISPR-associated protein TM1802 [Moorella glycerini]
MLEAMSELGKALAGTGGEEFLANILEPLPSRTRKGQTRKVILLDFDTRADKINVEVEEVKEKETPKKYLWIGNAKGNKPQRSAATSSLIYLLSQTLPNIARELPEGSSLRAQVEKVLAHFYRDMPGGMKVLDVEGFGLAGEGFSMTGLLEQVKGNSKNFLKKLTDAVEAWIRKNWGLSKDEIALWVVSVDGVPLSSHPEYRDLVYRIKIEDALEETISGCCSSCGLPGQVAIDVFKELEFKYYILDKISFASGVTEKGFYHNLTLCASCYSNLLAAEKFVKNWLNTQIGNFNCYVIPGFLFEALPAKKDLEDWAAYVINTIKVANNLKSLYELEKELDEFLEEGPLDNKAILNLLFYHKPAGRSEFKVLRLIKDVSPTRIKKLVRSINKVSDVGKGLLGGESREWVIDLHKIYYLIPLKTGDVNEYKKILDIYDSLISERQFDYAFLINQFTELIAIYQLRRFSNSNIRVKDEKYVEYSMAMAVLQANLFLYLLRKLGQLKGVTGVSEDFQQLNVDQNMKSFLQEMGYNGAQAAMFLLGYLIEQVGWSQAQHGHENKPVLEKINYQGMSLARLQHLANVVFNLLHQYKILTFNERLYAEMKKVMDQYVNSWPLSPEENVFYLLSGYSYGVRRAASYKGKEEQA